MCDVVCSHLLANQGAHEWGAMGAGREAGAEAGAEEEAGAYIVEKLRSPGNAVVYWCGYACPS